MEYQTTVTTTRTVIRETVVDQIPTPKTGAEYLKAGALDNLSDETLKEIIMVQFAYYRRMVWNLFGLNLSHTEVVFEKRGKSTGGTCRGSWKIDYNLDWARANLQGFLTEVVPHEIAHAVNHEMNGEGHDRQWKYIMRRMGVKPTRCVHSDMEGVKSARKTRRFRYVMPCGCDFTVGKKVHNQLQTSPKGTRRCTAHKYPMSRDQFVEEV